MAIRKGIFKVRNTATGEKDEVMLKTTIEQVDDLDKLIGATANAAGVWGLAPAPAKGSQNLPLCGDAGYYCLRVGFDRCLFRFDLQCIKRYVNK